MELTRINNDVNGNPRYVVHYSEFINEQNEKFAKKNSDILYGKSFIEIEYEIALKKAKTIGGKKFHNKQYGGGIVFQSYNTQDLIKRIEEIRSVEIRTVDDFLNASGLTRGARKRTIDKWVNDLFITDGDLIADIYGFLGI